MGAEYERKFRGTKAAWEYLQQWLEDWCVANPATNVVRPLQSSSKAP